ncbi:hypothetical protein PC116_g33162 [Phytophthora cactorum]|nr:hypothetical protein PC116_g33162 [Phytophthora cactorum]
MVKDGHWRAEDPESERAAWEESVRLRDQMFWSRIGGGVVPVISHVHSSSGEEPSARNSQDANRTSIDENKNEAVTIITPDESESTPKPPELNQDNQKPEQVTVNSEDQGAGSAGDSIKHLELTDVDTGKSQQLSLTIPDASSKEASE